MSDGSDPTDDPIATARSEGRTTLTEPESKRVLSAAGIETPAFRVVSDADAAADAASDLGFPVVVKVASPTVTHKSEWADGTGVALGLDSAAAVRTAAERILDAARDADVEADVLVESAADTTTGTEIIVGGLRDPSFGPVVLTGLGGIFAEVYEDTSHRLAPIDRAEARRAVEELRAARLLTGFRGRPPADVDAVADALVRVGDLLVDRPEIAEIDVNPVLTTGGGAVALDALVVLAEADDE